jgi:hypothetical protein
MPKNEKFSFPSQFNHANQVKMQSPAKKIKKLKAGFKAD